MNNLDFKNQYEIIKTLGKGMYSKVYKAKKKDTNEFRAIKIIDLNEIREELKKENLKEDISYEFEQYIKQLLNEIENMKLCKKNNDNSLEFFEYFTTEDYFALVIELCDYNLTQVLINRENGFNPKEIYNIISQLNNTFKIMKENKIVHRDLKLDNILIKYENKEKSLFKVKLCDYGISKYGNFIPLKTHIGTEAYMAPEIMELTEVNNYNYKCDLWSLGIIIYELSFKDRPYKGKTEVALLKGINKFGKTMLKKTGDVNLDDLINKLLEKDPEKRITWDEYFNHPFFIKEDDEKEDNIDNTRKDSDLLPYRPELETVILQKITLLVTPISGPNHPRTVYFMNDPKLNDNLLQKKFKIEKFEISEKKYMVLYKAYKNLPLCTSEPMRYNGIIRTKLFENTNIIWKLKKEKEMLPFIKSLNKYQKYNHFPISHEITRKDNLYKNYCNMKIKFPNDYYYMAETYILPQDNKIFIEEKLKDFNLNDKTNLWIIKPCGKSKGSGIELLTNIENIPKNILVTHYIYNPHLINGKKYDLRIYLLVTGFCPLKIYLYDNGFTRFCKEKYDLSPENMSNKYIHLTDYPFNDTEKEKWSLHKLKIFFEENNLDFNKIWLKIKDIIIKVVLSITDIAIPIIKPLKLSSGNLFELYGVDILIDEYFNPWLLEINLNPSLNCDNPLDLKIKSKLITDILNIIGVVPFSHDGKFILMDKPNEYKDSIEEGLIESLCEFERPTGDFERIFPLKNNIKYYSQFIKEPEKENLALWKELLSK